MHYDWDFRVLFQYKTAFARGLLATLALSLVSISLGSVLGLAWGLLLGATKNAWLELRLIAVVFNDIVRALPLLILILLFNYLGPIAFGIHSLFLLAMLSLSLNLAAFLADVLRGAISGVPRPLVEAGLAVGMSDSQVLRWILLPEAVRSTVPSITLLYIDILKMSSLASVIGFAELTYVGGEVSGAEFKPLEPLVLVAAIYIVMVTFLGWLQRRLEASRWFVRRS